jgi:hypothetical protein
MKRECYKIDDYRLSLQMANYTNHGVNTLNSLLQMTYSSEWL